MSTKCPNIRRWAFDISRWRPTLEELSIATACIQQEEKSRLLKFHFRDDFDSSLIGRLLMRKYVRDVTGLEYDTIKFNRDIRGKPFLVSTPITGQSIDFNVSHQGNFSVLAGISQQNETNNDMQIGIDIMKIEYAGGKPLNEFFRLMHRNFSDEEWRFIKGRQNEHDQLQAFMRHWCLKESYVKNIGIGITVDLQKISFHIKTDELIKNQVVTNTQIKVNDTHLNNWLFEEHLLDDEHCVAISFKNPVTNIDVDGFILLQFDDLIEDCIPLLEEDEEYCRTVLRKEYKRKYN